MEFRHEGAWKVVILGKEWEHPGLSPGPCPVRPFHLAVLDCLSFNKLVI